MLFNSHQFIFLFLPIAIALFYLSGRLWFGRPTILLLLAISLAFYGWGEPTLISLLVGSIVANYLLAIAIHHYLTDQFLRRILIAGGVALNLSVLGYFKYAIFMTDSFNAVVGTSFDTTDILLPLAISFYTFQQIGYLVDVSRGLEPERDLLRYGLFVSFFPQLIAGPIVRARTMLPQLRGHKMFEFDSSSFSYGLTLFSIGLFKKVVIADSIAQYSDSVFGAAAAGEAFGTGDAWLGAMAFGLQIYFDFSGYSDMAVGLARMFNIRLPWNFRSPYRSGNVVEFWATWHISLSTWLRDYLYIPLGGSRRGVSRRYSNLMATMLLGGLWHGAAWTFVVWGGLHGAFLIINHAWRHVSGNQLRWRPGPKLGAMTGALGILITYLSVTFAWVFFRAESISDGWSIIGSMSDVFGIIGSGGTFSNSSIVTSTGGTAAGLVIVIGLICLMRVLPDSYEWMNGRSVQKTPEEDDQPNSLIRSGIVKHTWAPSVAYSLVVLGMLFLSITQIESMSEFIYFRF